MGNVIDAHIHIFKYGEHWSEWAAKSWIEQFPGIYWLTGKDFVPEDYHGPYEFAIEWMDKSGVDKAFLFGNWQAPHDIKVPTEYLVEAVKKFPDRFYAFSAPDPLGGEKSLEELEWAIKDENFVGLKILPTYNYVHPMDERIWPLYRKAAELGGCIVIHTGYGPVLKNRLKWQHPYEHEDLLEELNDTPISFGHCGFHYYQDAMLMMTRHRKLYADFAWWHVFPIDYIARAFVFAKSIDVFDRLMFGTDFPHTNIAEVMKIYQRIPEYTLQHGLEPLITEDDLKSFFYENAENFVRSRNAT